MNRRPFGWDLPPGVTDRQIDEAARGDEAEASYVQHVDDMDAALAASRQRVADLTDKLGHSMQVEHALRIELARRNAALIAVAEAAQALLDAAGPNDWPKAFKQLRAALADVPKAEP